MEAEELIKKAKYYYDIEDFEEMVKYYLMAISVGNNVTAMYNLGTYYYNINDFENMMKYYHMAIQNNDVHSMINMGAYYHSRKDFEIMKLYYLRAIELGNSDAMFNMGRYYMDIKKDYDMGTKYYMMAAEKGNSDAIKILEYINDLKKCDEDEDEDEECIVCYNMTEMYYTRCQRHSICFDCSIKLYNKPCPMCRQ
jgi:TPR repeat protein